MIITWWKKNRDFRSSSIYMESWGYFSDNRTMFIMSMPLASIRESVALSNRFTTWVGLSVLVFGSIMMCFVTNRITKPIMKLSALSEEMSKLNFDVAYEDDAEDEVGVLGRSMNSLSHSLKDAIGALQDANKQLQHDIDEKIQIDEMRKEFIANVSHELKTPIALIQGYAEGLCDGMCEDEESRSYYCEVIMDEANKMNKMVRQLLTLTALEFGNDTPSIAAFDVTELVHDLINSSGILIQQNAAKVSVDMPETLVVMGDEFKIEEVVTNYLTNAMNHLGGDHNIRIWSETLDGVAKIHVYNNGTPIPEEDLPNLWTKFYKGRQGPHPCLRRQRHRTFYCQSHHGSTSPAVWRGESRGWRGVLVYPGFGTGETGRGRIAGREQLTKKNNRCQNTEVCNRMRRTKGN